jgi:hypothetical protein
MLFSPKYEIINYYNYGRTIYKLRKNLCHSTYTIIKLSSMLFVLELKIVQSEQSIYLMHCSNS